MEETGKTAMAALERFVVLLYDRTSDLLQVNDARKQLFTQKSRSLENIPLTYSALKEHVKRASIKHTAGTSRWFLILIFQVRQIGAGR